MKKRVLSGIRATGQLHLGNYLGAVKGMLALQDDPNYETYYMVADGHTITTPYSPEELRENRRGIVLDYLAAGLNPQKSVLFIQSDIPAHFELAFYLSSVITIARLQHLPTFKEKVKQYPQHSTMALLNYPVLQAADILAYNAHAVPVGTDQEPHLEVARELARKMNELYHTTFVEPVRFATPGEYVPSLKGVGKMSKSVEGSYIAMTDTQDQIHKKVRSIPTATVSGGEMSPGVKALFTLVHLFMPTEHAQYLDQYTAGTLQFGTLKDALSQAIYTDLVPFQKKRAELIKERDYVDRIITEGTARAAQVASSTVTQVRKQMGLLS